MLEKRSRHCRQIVDYRAGIRNIIGRIAIVFQLGRETCAVVALIL